MLFHWLHCDGHQSFGKENSEVARYIGYLLFIVLLVKINCDCGTIYKSDPADIENGSRSNPFRQTKNKLSNNRAYGIENR